MKHEQVAAEHATGIAENPGGLGKFYSGSPEPLTFEQARELIREDKVIEVPNAGAGSYREVFSRLGFDDVELVDSTSSAGDWNFVVKADGFWFVAEQNNRHPYHGFSYEVTFARGFDTKEQCIGWWAEECP